MASGVSRAREVQSTSYRISKFSRCHASLELRVGIPSFNTRWSFRDVHAPAIAAGIPAHITNKMRPSSSSSVQGVCRRITLALRSSPRQQSKPAAAQFARQLSNDAKTPQFGGGNSISRTSSLPKLPPSMLRPGESGVQPQEEQEQKQATEDEQSLEPPANEEAIHQLQQAAYSYTGLNFEPPPMPQDKLPRAKYHMRYRYDEGISQLTKLLMRDGKLGKAQNVSIIPSFSLVPLSRPLSTCAQS